jgi:hypothetical protein
LDFLVRPNDLASIQEIMRYCAAVWGGIYNPIIPVFSKPPKAWATEPFDRIRGIGVAKGYIRFFEPDVYVEAEKGLLELVGLGAVRDRLTVYPDVLMLADLLKPEQHKDWCEPAFGLNIHDVQLHLYQIDQQFTKRDQRENIIVTPEKGSGISELIFGVFPTQKSVAHIARGYHNAFKPTKLEPSPDSWKKAFGENAVTLCVRERSSNSLPRNDFQPMQWVGPPCILSKIALRAEVGESLSALEFMVKVMVFADVVTVPDVDEAVSQLGGVIEYFTLP